MTQGWGKIIILVSIILVFLLLTFIFSSLHLKTCQDFNTKQEAENAYKKDPFKYRDLDRNNDGEVCEQLPVKNTQPSIIEKILPTVVNPKPTTKPTQILTQPTHSCCETMQNTPSPAPSPTPNFSPEPAKSPTPTPLINIPTLICVKGVCL